MQCVGLLTGMSWPLAAEAGLVASALGDRDRDRSSSTSSSCSLASSKFMLPDRPGEGEEVKLWESSDYNFHVGKFIHARQEENKSQRLCVYSRVKRTSKTKFDVFGFGTKYPQGGLFIYFFWFIYGLWYMTTNFSRTDAILKQCLKQKHCITQLK